MAVKRKKAPVRKVSKKNIRIPRVLIQEFMKSPIIDLGGTEGYWPIAANVLRKADFFKKLAGDRQFKRDFDVMIIPKAR